MYTLHCKEYGILYLTNCEAADTACTFITPCLREAVLEHRRRAVGV